MEAKSFVEESTKEGCFGIFKRIHSLKSLAMFLTLFSLFFFKAQNANGRLQDAPIKEMHWIKDHNVLVTGSWDKTLRYWDLRSPQPVMTVNLTERVYCMDVKNPLVVVGVAEKKIHVFTMQKPNQEFKVIHFYFPFSLSLFFFFS